MGIYTLSLKNLRRKRLRNLSIVLRISLGVIILLILVSSGMGINSVLEKSGTSEGKLLASESANQTGNVSNQTDIVSSVTGYFNSVSGSSLTENQILSGLKDFITNAVYALDVIASVALLFGVLGIMNTMGFNLSERQREIGLLKTMGFTKIQILISLTLEAGLLGFIGALIGVIIGILVIWAISTIMGPGLFTIMLSPMLFLGAILITTLLSLILGLYPAWFTAGIDVQEALDFEY
jgi:putative ABC transport system permease protein